MFKKGFTMSTAKEPLIRLLSTLFYERYSNNPEILSKQNRPYLVLLVEYRGLRFAIPFRSNIQHTHAYKFQGTSPKRQTSGLDFSKTVLIFHDDEIGMPAHIDSKEHTEILKRFNFIIEKFHKYIDAFIDGLKQEPLQPKYKLSSLTFYKELLLSSSI